MPPSSSTAQPSPPTQAPEHIAFLDSFRGIAILAVFFFHSFSVAFRFDQITWAGWWCSFDQPKSFLLLLPSIYGSSGVAIFFVVSGLCIHLSFQRRPVWREFLVRRFFRIYPPYLFALLLFALAFPLTRLAFTTPVDGAQLGTHLLLLHNFDARFFFGVNPSFWSIAVEAQLYLLYPVLLWIVNRLGWPRTMVALALLEVLLRGLASTSLVAGGEAPRWLTGSPFFYWFSWSAGAYLAETFLRRQTPPFANWPLGLLVLAALVSRICLPLTPFFFLLCALSTAIVAARMLRGDRWPLRLPEICARQLERAGLWSYSLYLLHQPFLIAVGWLFHRAMDGRKLPEVIVYAVCLTSWWVLLPLAALWYRGFELSSIALGKRVLARLRRTCEEARPCA